MKRTIYLSGLLVVLAVVVSAQERITEDDPRWDCKTMGNKICGPGYELEPLYVTAHHGHFDAVNMAGVMLSEFETYAQLEKYAREKGFRLVKGNPVMLCGAPTKKGTPCKHRVKKAGDHCYLHGGAK